MTPHTTGQFALTEAEVQAMLSTITVLEHEALLRLAIATGMRREDVVNIKLQDLDIEGGIVKFWEAKKRRVWQAWVSGDTLKTLAQHIDKLPKNSKWLFPSPWNAKKHLSSRQAYNHLQKYLEKAGLRKRPFHALRATHIKLAQRKGWTIEMVMRQTGDTFRTIKEHYETPSDDEMDETARGKPIL